MHTSASRQRQPAWLWIAVAAWLACTGAGLWVLWAYENRPGVAAVSPGTWPTATRLVRASDRPTLVLMAHPQCSCTAATLGELGEALARAVTRPKTFVVFLRPSGFREGWEQTQLWRTAAALPDTTVLRDDDGAEAERFGAATSGQALLYDAGGTLRFSGGLTGARGHAGDNAGRATLLALLNGERTEGSATPVFGCPLFAHPAESL